MTGTCTCTVHGVSDHVRTSGIVGWNFQETRDILKIKIKPLHCSSLRYESDQTSTVSAKQFVFPSLRKSLSVIIEAQMNEWMFGRPVSCIHSNVYPA